jgi:hypothetical protein
MSNLGRDQAKGPSFLTGRLTTLPSLPSCEWLRPTRSSSCASARVAAGTTASPVVECRPTRPVRADPPKETIPTTTGTTTINPAKRAADGLQRIDLTREDVTINAEIRCYAEVQGPDSYTRIPQCTEFPRYLELRFGQMRIISSISVRRGCGGTRSDRSAALRPESRTQRSIIIGAGGSVARYVRIPDRGQPARASR